MVSPAPDAWLQHVIIAHSNRVSAANGLRCRATGFQGQRQLGRNLLPSELVSSETTAPTAQPAGSGPFGAKREIPKFERVRGGPGRARTSNQTVMSGPAAPENPCKIEIFRHVHAPSFASVHGVSVVNLWSVLGRRLSAIGGRILVGPGFNSGGPGCHRLLTASASHRMANTCTSIANA